MPAIYVKTGGAFEPVLQPYVKDGGSWEPVLNAWTKTAGAWELIWTGFTVAATPASETVETDLPTVSSSLFTATPTGGVGPFTYAWSKVSGDSIVITTPTLQTTRFQANTMTSGSSRSAVFECAVTDTTTGVVATSNTVSVTLTRP